MRTKFVIATSYAVMSKFEEQFTHFGDGRIYVSTEEIYTAEIDRIVEENDFQIEENESHVYIRK